jgi:C-terminal processing protease CtpA/Prc
VAGGVRVGDLLTSLDGKSVSDLRGLKSILAHLRLTPGFTTRFTCFASTKVQILTLMRLPGTSTHLSVSRPSADGTHAHLGCVYASVCVCVCVSGLS